MCTSLVQYLICYDDSNSEFIGKPLQHPQTQAKMLLTSRKFPSSLKDLSKFVQDRLKQNLRVKTHLVICPVQSSDTVHDN